MADEAFNPIQINPLDGRVIWEQQGERLRVYVDRRKQQVRFTDETEESCTIIVEPKDAPSTGKLKPRASDYR